MTKRETNEKTKRAKTLLKEETAAYAVHALHSLVWALETAEEGATFEDVTANAQEGAAYDVGEYIRHQF